MARCFFLYYFSFFFWGWGWGRGVQESIDRCPATVDETYRRLRCHMYRARHVTWYSSVTSLDLFYFSPKEQKRKKKIDRKIEKEGKKEENGVGAWGRR